MHVIVINTWVLYYKYNYTRRVGVNIIIRYIIYYRNVIGNRFNDTDRGRNGSCVFTYTEIQPAPRFLVLTTRSTTADFRQQ